MYTEGFNFLSAEGIEPECLQYTQGNECQKVKRLVHISQDNRELEMHTNDCV